MGMRAVVVRVNDMTHYTVHHAVPQSMTTSEWIRLQVKCLLAQPESESSWTLKRLIADKYRGGINLGGKKPFKLMFRVEAEHWAALTAVAAAADFKRTDYLRRMLYMGARYKVEWYHIYLTEEAEGALT